jgi:hypothetical protein
MTFIFFLKASMIFIHYGVYRCHDLLLYNICWTFVNYIIRKAACIDPKIHCGSRCQARMESCPLIAWRFASYSMLASQRMKERPSRPVTRSCREELFEQVVGSIHGHEVLTSRLVWFTSLPHMSSGCKPY